VSKKVEVLVGTKKGAFILESNEARRDWRLRGPFCQNWPTHDFVRATDGTLYAGGGNNWYGPSVWRSAEWPRNWSNASRSRPRPQSIACQREVRSDRDL